MIFFKTLLKHVKEIERITAALNKKTLVHLENGTKNKASRNIVLSLTDLL